MNTTTDRRRGTDRRQHDTMRSFDVPSGRRWLDRRAAPRPAATPAPAADETAAGCAPVGLRALMAYAAAHASDPLPSVIRSGRRRA